MSDEMTPIVEASADEQLAKELVERARSEGVQLIGRGGLLSDLTKTVLETALDVEMEDPWGADIRSHAAGACWYSWIRPPRRSRR